MAVDYQVPIGGSSSVGAQSVASSWDGSSWSTQVLPAGPDGYGVSGVSCPAAADCWVTLSAGFGSPSSPPVLLHESAGSWSTETLSGPSGASLDAISCSSAVHCVAVGQAQGSSLAISFNGSTWSQVGSGIPGDFPNAVSCVSSTQCFAVGSAAAGGVLALACDTSSCAQMKLPPLSGGSSDSLHGISCASATSCLAVGYEVTQCQCDGGGQSYSPVSLRYTGYGWIASPPPAAAGALLAVSCAAADMCMTGSNEFSLAEPPASAQIFDGSAWSEPLLPVVSPMVSVTLAAVACPSTTACFAAGYYGSGGGQPLLAEYGPQTVPSAPLDVISVAHNGRASLSWEPPLSDGAATLSGYEVLVSPACDQCAGTTVMGSPPTPGTVVTGLTDGQAYTFSVVAQSAIGSSPPSAASPAVTPEAPSATAGYWMTTAGANVYGFGAASEHVGHFSPGTFPAAPVVGMAATPDGGGYWLVAADGGVFSFGDASFFGSMGSQKLNAPVVGMAATPDGGGYWLVAADGGVFSFGDARASWRHFYGSLGAVVLPAPVVGIAAA
ncbi:MAG: fibronectin type III domain-containing protein [Actinomycetota bacterium]|nr:fibronectin type III domain-containing protein [Actinomycetota bacterium]